MKLPVADLQPELQMDSPAQQWTWGLQGDLWASSGNGLWYRVQTPVGEKQPHGTSVWDEDARGDAARHITASFWLSGPSPRNGCVPPTTQVGCISGTFWLGSVMRSPLPCELGGLKVSLWPSPAGPKASEFCGQQVRARRLSCCRMLISTLLLSREKRISRRNEYPIILKYS